MSKCSSCTKLTTPWKGELKIIHEDSGNEIGRLCDTCEENFWLPRGFTACAVGGMLSDDQEDAMNRIESELETLQCQSEDCVLIDDANDLMDAVQEQVEEIDSILPLRKHFDLSGKIDTIINNLQSVLDKDKE